MSKMSEKVAYLKGLAEGLGVSGESREDKLMLAVIDALEAFCLLYTSPSPRDYRTSRMPSSA